MRRISAVVLFVMLGWLQVGTVGRFSPKPVPGQPTTAIPTETQSRPATARLLDAAGLTLPRADLPTQWLHAVVVDIDSDGDEDLVVNVGSLELGVWLNDGSGRLTRAPAVEGPAQWIPEPPIPSYDNQTFSLDAAAPDEPPSVRPEPARAGPVVTSVRAYDAGAVRPTHHDPSAPSSPRAPPLA